MSNPPKLQLGSILKRTFQVVSGNFPSLAAIAVTVFSPIFLLLAWLTWLSPSATRRGLEADDPLVATVVIFVALLGAFLSQLQAGAFTYAVFESLRGKSQRGRPLPVARSLRVAASRLVRMVLAGILAGLAIAGATLLLIIPGLIVALGLCIVIPVVVVEKFGVVDSIKRSWELTHGYKAQIYGLAMLWAFIVVPIQLAIRYLELGVASSLWVGQTVNLLLSFFSATMVTILYHDLRAIKDGLGADDLVAVFE